VGEGINTIAYSSDGIIWRPSDNGNSIFTIRCNGVAWNGTRWVAVGEGNFTIAYSSDGITWTGVANSLTNIFSANGNGVAWNGTLWVAVGSGSGLSSDGGNSIAYSSDGITWTGLGLGSFNPSGNGVAWNGTRWVAVGEGTNTIAYSSDGIIWTGLGKTMFNFQGRGVAGNPKVGATIVPSQIVINKNSINQTNKLDIATGDYYNNGPTQVAITINSINS
jgi:hypothetical protein